MIRTTNDVTEFIEMEQGPILIYGAGNPGYWVGKYMHLCNITFEGYIDKGAKEECESYGKPIYHPVILKSFHDPKQLRIILAVGNPGGALADLHWYAGKRNIVCLVPIYEDYITKERIYDINKLLSYFRSKLITTEIPTILSNSCNAGFIYRMLGVQRISPTINNIIWPKDFLKLCEEPYKYLTKDIIFSHWTIYAGKTIPVGRIEDIEVYFVHDKNAEEAINRWNLFRKRINWDCLIFIFSEDTATITYSLAKAFCALNEKHMLIFQKNMYCSMELRGSIYMQHGHFHIRNSAIENYFDLLGWINDEYEI